MREETKDPWRLQHIIAAINRVENFVDQMTYNEFIDDDKTYYAVVKNIEIIGEAANMLTHKFKELNSQIPWKAICGMRNYIVHEYFAVDSKVVWEVVTSDLPQLKVQLMNIKKL